MGILRRNDDKTQFLDIDTKCVNVIKSLAIDTIIGNDLEQEILKLEYVPIMYLLYKKYLSLNISDENFINQDVVLLSDKDSIIPHLATLTLSGINTNIDILKNVSSFFDNNIHIATGVGIGLSESYKSDRYKYTNQKSLINHYTYIFASDKELMEGSSYEALSLAGALSLNKLVLIYINNSLKDDLFHENVIERFHSMNWNTVSVVNNTLEDLDCALKNASLSLKPTFIEIRSNLHNKIIDTEYQREFKKCNDLLEVSFNISKDAYQYFSDIVSTNSSKLVKNYNKKLDELYPNIKENYKKEINSLLKGKVSLKMKDFDPDGFINITSKRASEFVLEQIKDANNLFMGGYLNTKCEIYDPKALPFLSRTSSAGYILNGINKEGIRTYLVLSDKDIVKVLPSMVEADKMGLSNLYIIYCDSFDLSFLNNLENATIYKPTDVNELIGSYKKVLDDSSLNIILIPNENFPIYKETSINDVKNGAYFIKNPKSKKGVIISNGIDLKIGKEVVKRLHQKRINVALVSMPSVRNFMKQPKKYRDEILKNKVFILTNENTSLLNSLFDNMPIFTIQNENKEYNINQLVEKIESYFK